MTSRWQFRITVGLSQKIVIDQSMTLSYYSWVITENYHWPVNDNFRAFFWKMSLTGQWQFCSYYSWVITENCHWPVNDNFCSHKEWVITEIVIDRSMTFLSRPFQIVIDWSMTILIVLQLDYQWKLSLTGLWQFWLYYSWVFTENCHWPVSENS